MSFARCRRISRPRSSNRFAPHRACACSRTRKLTTSGGLVSLLKKVTNNTNATLAKSVVGNVTGQVLAPVIGNVTTIQLINSITAPIVYGLSANTALTDGMGVAGLTLTYETNYPALIGADDLHRGGVTGKGVTIAVLDTGLWQDLSQNYGGRILASIDVTNGGKGSVKDDPYGHGTHVTSIAASGAQNLAGGYLGVAPKSNLVVVRAFDGEGAGRYVDVIQGINWIVANKKKYNVRVLNLSLGAPPQSYYWDDPLNQAVMAAWKAGIVVVVSSGNSGPDPMTVEVPGNVPYVITVGALTDNGTPYNGTDDRLASFSSTGPTFEGFVKPEIVSPGGHIAASMSSSSYLANIDPDSMAIGQQMFTMSGTSQAAAVTTGVVALMLQADPTLTPDTVKCRLILSARPAIKPTGALAYSVFQQGAGLINAVEAVNGSGQNCANQGLDLDADIAGTAHFGGPANQDDKGNYYVMDMSGGSWGRPGDVRRLHVVALVPLESGLRVESGLHLEPRIHLVARLHVEPWVHVVARLYVEPRLHLEPYGAVVERASDQRSGGSPGVYGDVGAERVTRRM